MIILHLPENTIYVFCVRKSAVFPCINCIFAIGPFGLSIQLASFEELSLFTSWEFLSFIQYQVVAKTWTLAPDNLPRRPP